jgi:hypothetical protein
MTVLQVTSYRRLYQGESLRNLSPICLSSARLGAILGLGQEELEERLRTAADRIKVKELK